jgi:hypothetical protein
VRLLYCFTALLLYCFTRRGGHVGGRGVEEREVRLEVRVGVGCRGGGRLEPGGGGGLEHVSASAPQLRRLLHTPAYSSIRRDTSAYVSIRPMLS